MAVCKVIAVFGSESEITIFLGNVLRAIRRDYKTFY
jgi:hypothetical protein